MFFSSYDKLKLIKNEVHSKYVGLIKNGVAYSRGSWCSCSGCLVPFLYLQPQKGICGSIIVNYRCKDQIILLTVLKMRSTPIILAPKDMITTALTLMRSSAECARIVLFSSQIGMLNGRKNVFLSFF